MRKKGQSKSQLKTDQLKGDWKALEIVHPQAAGIDIGGSEHWVAINPERDEQPVRCFDCFTADLEQMADWLVDRGVRSVAMQSTGSSTVWKYGWSMRGIPRTCLGARATLRNVSGC